VAPLDDRRPAPDRWGLTARELEVARLIACGEPTKAIAATLGISVHTACRHTERIYAKLGVRSRTQLVLAFNRASGAAPAAEPRPALGVPAGV
jgi:DNA-binding NarL/FixJ family response regulator